MILENGLSDMYNSQVQALGVCIMAQVPLIIWGPPGVGKSSAIYQLTDHYQIHCETVMANIREASDFAGLPAVIENEVHFAPPVWVKNLQRASAEGQKTLTFYDEISTARPEVRAAMLRPILEGVVGEEKLPDNNITVGAANHPDIAAGGWDLDGPTANRFVHIDWNVTASDVAYGFSRGWPPIMLPLVHKKKLEKVEEAKKLIAAFISARPMYIDGKVPDLMGAEKAPDYAFPTPRSLDFAATLYGYSKSVRFMNPEDRSQHPISKLAVEKLITGVIGEQVGLEFLDFINNLDLPDPKRLLANPSSFQAPERTDILNAIIYSVEAQVKEENPISEKTWLNWGDILVEILNQGYADIAYASGKEWMRLRPQGTTPNKAQTATFKKLFDKLDEAI